MNSSSRVQEGHSLDEIQRLRYPYLIEENNSQGLGAYIAYVNIESYNYARSIPVLRFWEVLPWMLPIFVHRGPALRP